MSIAPAVENKLNLIASKLNVEFKRAVSTKNDLGSECLGFVSEGKIQEAQDALNRFCCQYEHEMALGYILHCISRLKAINLVNVFTGKTCPDEAKPFLAPLCFLATIKSIPELQNLISSLVKVWGQQEVEALKHSNTISDNIVHVDARGGFTLDELHMFIQRFRERINLDLSWFYQNFPSKAAPTQNVSGPATPRNVPEKAPPTRNSVTLTGPQERGSARLSPLAPFKVDTYEQMMDYVSKVLANWQ